MGACCASGGREAGFDQKEDKLTGAGELKKDGEVMEKAGKPQTPAAPKESPDDATFKTNAAKERSSNAETNVRLPRTNQTYRLRTISWANSSSTSWKMTERSGY